MVKKFLIRNNESNVRYRFFSPQDLKTQIQSSSITGLTLYEDQSKFFRNTSELGTCGYLSFSVDKDGELNQKNQRLDSFPISTSLGGLEVLSILTNLLTVGNSMLESLMKDQGLSHFGIDFIPLESIQANQRKSDEELVRKADLNNSITTFPIPETYRGRPEILIPEIIFYDLNSLNLKHN